VRLRVVIEETQIRSVDRVRIPKGLGLGAARLWLCRDDRPYTDWARMRRAGGDDCGDVLVVVADVGF
jgi:hypothetical protein